MKAVWNDTVVAESDDTIVIERNHYFPPDSIHWEYLTESDNHTICPWKGNASYYHLEVDGQVNRDAVWSYPEPGKAAGEIKEYLAFWKGVRIEK